MSVLLLYAFRQLSNIVGTDIPTRRVASYCGQTAGWVKTLLGTEVDLGAGHIVIDGFPALR